MKPIHARIPPPATLISLALALAAGLASYYASVPLAWIVGPLTGTAIAGISGLPVFAPVSGRRFGQMIIGAVIGLSVTGDVLASIGYWVPIMIATSTVAIVFGAVVSVPFGRMARVDRKTAFFAMMPGGLSEMANLGAAFGAQSEPIAVSQALRVALLVCLLPPLIIALDIHGDAVAAARAQDLLSIFDVLVTAAMGVSGVMVARLLRFNNPWMVGAIVGVAVGAVSGLLAGRLPYGIYYGGQFLIGISIGARFRRDILRRLPLLFTTSAIFIVILALCLLAYAAGLSAVTGLDFASAALGAAPGGLAEMAVTAQSLHLSIGLVTAFHIVRAFMVNGFTSHFWKGFHRIGLFDFTDRVLDHLTGRGR